MSAEELAPQPSEVFPTMFDNLPGMVFRRISTPSGYRFAYLSRGCAELTGHEPDDLIAPGVVRYEDLIHPEDRQKFGKELWDAIELSADYELDYRIITASGVTKWIREKGHPTYHEDGTLDYVDGIATDAMARKKIEDGALAASEEKYHQLVDLAPIAIIVQTNGIIRFVNRAGLEIMGAKDRTEVVGQSAHQFVHPETLPFLMNRVKKIMETGEQSEPTNMKFLRPDGKVIYVDSAAGPITYQGEPSIQVVMRDVTDRILLEEQLRQSQKMEAIGRLAGGVAHDFNNLLTAINGYAELGLRRMNDPDRLHRDLTQILKAGESGASLVHQLLAFSRKQVLQPKVLDVNKLIAGMEGMLQRLIGEDINLITDLGPDVANLKADPGQIEQVMMNLVINARDAMPHGGRLTITSKNAGEVTLPNREGDGEATVAAVNLAVADTGYGMEKGTVDRIFEPFFTTKETGKGTGLGLSTVYGIVNQSGGEIAVHSSPGEGTTFDILLPAATEEIDESECKVGASPGGSESVLLVEDDPNVRDLAKQILVHEGYQVTEAASGEEALDLMAAGKLKVDILVTDVVMPGMGGAALARQFRKFHPQTRILFMSGYTEDAIVQHGVLESDVAFLQKPFRTTEFAQKVRDVLDDNPY